MTSPFFEVVTEIECPVDVLEGVVGQSNTVVHDAIRGVTRDGQHEGKGKVGCRPDCSCHQFEISGSA